MIDWLLATLVATSALIALVLLVREPVRKWFGSRVTYGLWLIPAARLFMPTLTHVVERTIPAPAAIPPLAEPLVSDQLWMARVAPMGSSPIDQAGGWPTLFVAAWLAVATTLFVSRMIAYGRDRRAILAASVPVARIGAVRIVRSPEIASPVALGIFDRLIAVPSDFERLYDARERRLVLEHELAHHRSGDLVANLFAFVLLCLQWFNPLAWVAHAAFRFDQEAACDARVLDEATRADRGDYGRAIAKAASGRALLFASALDRRNTLQRRLQSMLCSSNPTKRLAGRLMVVSVVAVALPLTASRAVQYIDARPSVPTHPPAVAAPRALPPEALKAGARAATESSVARQVGGPADPAAAEPPLRLALASAAPEAMPLPQAVAAGVTVATAAKSLPRASWHDGKDNLTISGDLVTIDGTTKRWEDLTPGEKARVRDAVAKARASLQNVHIDGDRIAQDLARIPDPAQIAELQHQLAGTQANAAENAQVAMRSVGAVDWRRVAKSVADARRSVAAVDWPRVRQSAAGAQQSVEKARAELDRIQARIDADPNQ
jgi:bla regulator protein blaR1